MTINRDALELAATALSIAWLLGIVLAALFVPQDLFSDPLMFLTDRHE